MEKDKKLGLLDVVWIGFNFIAGITFTAGLGGVIGSTTGVGVHILWIYAVIGAITFICAWSFAKLVRVHPHANGGASQYTRTTLGKFAGFFTGFINYAYIPLIASTLLVSGIRSNFTSIDSLDWGNWENLYLDLIGLLVFAAAISVLFFGMRKYKIVSKIISYMSIALTVFVICVGIYAFADAGTTNIKEQYDRTPSLTAELFSSTFMTSFFAFCGIETFIMSANNVRDREKTMPKAITIIMILVTAFYIIFTLLMIGSIGQDFSDYKGNPIFELFGANKTFKDFGLAIIIICTILLRFNSTIQMTLFGGSSIEPLAQQKFIPSVFAKNDKDGLPIYGIIFTAVSFAIVIGLFIFVPDIIQGVTGNESPFGYGQLAGASSFYFLIIYGLAIVCVLINGIKKKMKVQIWEYIAFVICLGFLGFVFVMYIKGWVDGLINGIKEDDISAILGVVIQIVYILITLVVIAIMWFVYHPKKLASIKGTEEEKQLIEYEKNFVLLEMEQSVKVVKDKKVKTV